jgi:hypothetical protein
VSEKAAQADGELHVRKRRQGDRIGEKRGGRGMDVDKKGGEANANLSF